MRFQEAGDRHANCDYTLSRDYESAGTSTIARRYSGFTITAVTVTQMENRYTYDAYNRLSELKDGTTTVLATCTFDDPGNYRPGNLKKISRPLISSGTDKMDTSLTWFPYHDRIDVVENKKTGASAASTYDYTVNTLGQRTAVAIGGAAAGTGNSWTWSYDGYGQVTGADYSASTPEDRSWNYDGIGNRKKAAVGTASANKTGYTANTLNQYTKTYNDADADGIQDSGEADISSPTFDNNGNTTSNGLTGGLKNFTWDAEHRLIEVDDGTNTLATYTYDYRSRRVRKVTTSYATGGASNILFVYDGWNLISEYDGSQSTPITTANRLNCYDWGRDLSGSLQGAGGVGGLVRIVPAAGTALHCLYDANGNLTETTLTTTGAGNTTAQYDAFGNIMASSGTLAKFGFSTKYLDAETSFLYYGYRITRGTIICFYEKINSCNFGTCRDFLISDARTLR